MCVTVSSCWILCICFIIDLVELDYLVDLSSLGCSNGHLGIWNCIDGGLLKGPVSV